MDFFKLEVCSNLRRWTWYFKSPEEKQFKNDFPFSFISEASSTILSNGCPCKSGKYTCNIMPISLAVLKIKNENK